MPSCVGPWWSGWRPTLHLARIKGSFVFIFQGPGRPDPRRHLLGNPFGPGHLPDWFLFPLLTRKGERREGAESPGLQAGEEVNHHRIGIAVQTPGPPAVVHTHPGVVVAVTEEFQTTDPCAQFLRWKYPGEAAGVVAPRGE